MAELGALSLRIETVGDKQALSSLDAIDRKGQQTAASFSGKLTPAQKALNREIAESTQLFALQARTADLSDKQQVAGLRQVATAQLQYMQRVGASEKQLLQFAATAQAFEQRVAGATTNAAAGVQVFGREITNANGKVSAFGKSGLNAFNALAFGMSQMAATGTVSFRSLATSMTSVLAFFGTHGAIAAGAVATGLVIVDVFTRSRREIEETAKKAKEEIANLQASIDAQRRTADQSALIERFRQAEIQTRDARKELAVATQAVATAEASLAQSRREALGVEDLQAARAISTNQRALDTAKALERSLTNRVQLLEKEAALAKAAALNVESAVGPKGLPSKIEVQGVQETAKAFDEATKALNAFVAALLAADKANLTTATDLARIASVEKDLNEILNRTTTSYADRIKILQELAGLEAARLRLTRQQALVEKDLGKPAVGVTPGVGAVPPTGISIPPIKVPLEIDTSAFDAVFGQGNAIQQRLQAQLLSIMQAVTRGVLTEEEGRRLAQEANFAAGLTEGLSEAIATGLVAAVQGENIGEAVGNVLSQATGQILTKVALEWIAASKIMAAIQTFFVANPAAALLAAGALLVLGKSLGGKGAGVGGGSGAGGYGGSSGGGLDTIRSYVTGSDRFRGLNEAPKGLRDSIGDLRRSTFGADAIGALSPRTSLGSLTTASAPANPWSGMQFLVVNTPAGQSFVARDVVNAYNRDRGGR